MNRTIKFVVTLEMPGDVTTSQMKSYIEEAVAIWCKGMCPDDPIFDLDGDKVKVTRFCERRKP